MANIKSDGNYYFSKANLKAGVINFYHQIDPQIALTLTFNPPKSFRTPSVETVKRKYYSFIAKMNDHLYGNKNSKKKIRINLIGHIACIEHLTSNVHIHSVIHLPDIKLINEFNKYGKWLWENTITAGGDFHKQDYRDTGWGKYNSKDIFAAAHLDHLIY